METLILNRDERQAKLGASIVTACVAAMLLLFLFFWTIITPLPALPPNMEAPEIVIDFTSGGGNPDAGGASMGETGDPGQGADGGQQVDPQPPSENSASVTDDNPDNPAAPKGNSTKPSDKPSVNPMLEKLLNDSKKNKGKGSISQSGGGQGDDPYNSGAGGTDGPGIGPGHEPGPKGNGPGEGSGSGGKRRILSQPEVINPTQEEGKVRIKLTINREGKVVGTPTVVTEGTTTTNNILRATATQKGKQITFNAAPSDPEQVSLYITIDFTLK